MRHFPLIALVVSVLLIASFTIGYTLISSKNSPDLADVSATPTPFDPSSATSSASPSTTQGTYEYFWGDTCPHCANVAKFLESWEGKDKVKIDKKEIYRNPDNARLLDTRAQVCNLPKDQIPVPFLVTPERECITGDEPIINHFKSLNL